MSDEIKSYSPAGVTWDASHGRWKARIMRDGQSIHLGYFYSRKPAMQVVAKERIPSLKRYETTITLRVTNERMAEGPREAVDAERAHWRNSPQTKVLKVTARRLKP